MTLNLARVIASATIGGELDAVANTQTIGGPKVWNDVQQFKANAGVNLIGGYDTTGAWTIGPASGAASHVINGLTTINSSKHSSSNTVSAEWTYSGANGGGNSFSVTTNIDYAADGIYTFAAMGTSNNGPGAASGCFGYNSAGPSFQVQSTTSGQLTVTFANVGGKVQVTFTFTGAANSFAQIRINGRKL